MSASNEWWEYHLTPKGWVPGSWKTDFKQEDAVHPSDCVRCGRYSEYMSSGFSRMDRRWEVTPQKAKPGLRDKLIAKFGDRPESVPGDV